MPENETALSWFLSLRGRVATSLVATGASVWAAIYLLVIGHLQQSPSNTVQWSVETLAPMIAAAVNILIFRSMSQRNWSRRTVLCSMWLNPVTALVCFYGIACSYWGQSVVNYQLEIPFAIALVVLVLTAFGYIIKKAPSRV